MGLLMVAQTSKRIEYRSRPEWRIGLPLVIGLSTLTGGVSAIYPHKQWLCWLAGMAWFFSIMLLWRLHWPHVTGAKKQDISVRIWLILTALCVSAFPTGQIPGRWWLVGSFSTFAVLTSFLYIERRDPRSP